MELPEIALKREVIHEKSLRQASESTGLSADLLSAFIAAARQASRGSNVSIGASRLHEFVVDASAELSGRT